jgi:valyl-tRNA synthetase
MASNPVLDKVYNPREVEPETYELWERAGVFWSKPTDPPTPRERTFTIVIPPPNVTGALHLGHALNNTLQDILIRYHRMRGFNTLWQPGTDHAGIATQAVVERRIREQEGRTRRELGREELVRRIWEWKVGYESTILKQLKRMGCSCDWQRTRFTLDEGLALAVRHMFFKLFKDGLIFRGKRLVNWDTQLQTAVSDDEVYYEKVQGHFWQFKYPVIDPKPGEPRHVIIATTRPETMLGDTAVAVHPDPEGFFNAKEKELNSMWDRLSSRSSKQAVEIDSKLKDLATRRESHLAGFVQLRDMAKDRRRVLLPLVEREIPLIVDEWADPTLGTGCVKITPAHDPNDYEVGLRHDLPMVNVMTPEGNIARIIEPDGSVNPHSGDYEGLVFAKQGREKVVADLKARDLLHSIEDHETEIGHSDRSKLPIEPFLSDQWFVRTDDIPEPQASACANAQSSSIPRPRSPDLSFGATLLTWTTYGTWLPGEDRGSVSRAPRADGTQSLRNLPGEPYDRDDPQRQAAATERRQGKPLRLTPNHAPVLLSCIADTCQRHGIELLAIAILPNHVHVLCQGEQHGAEMLQVIKGNASRRLNRQFMLEGSPRWWTKSGSRRRIKGGVDLTAAIDYLKHQEYPLLIWSFDVDSGEAARIVNEARLRAYEESSGTSETVERRTIAQAEACGSGGIRLGDGSIAPGLAQAAMNAVEDGRIQVFPSRYAKSYLDWLGEKRDWCISRQLWWGHRIPMWRATDPGQIVDRSDRRTIASRLDKYEANGEAVHSVWRDPLTEFPAEIAPLVKPLMGYWCPSPNIESEFREFVECVGFRQDEDVLDTWFSSALWPFSTLGWPDETEHLKQYYPGSVLCTSRDIITNWVARMVMFGLYAMGKVPFDHVYIHPKILDGRGETMSKSKGNGVDPVHVIDTHGADALRYSMADMTTETQDIRMPVEYVCPHCGKFTHQEQALKAEEQARKSRGDKLDRKLQPVDCVRVTCADKDCAKEFATQWADDKTKKKLGLGLETSEKFDIGRNFCNKLWNAARFALMNLEDAPCERLDLAALPPEDRWILARLSQTIRRYHRCLRNYRFSSSVRELREFFWDSLCDWYIELTKPRLVGEPRAASPDGVEPSGAGRDAARQVLAFCIDQVLRLWHPTIPFITERLWRDLNHVAPRRGIPGVAELRTDTLLAVAEFPPVEGYPALEDDAILKVFAEIQDVVRAVRDLRAGCGVSPKDTVKATVVLPEDECEAFKRQAHIVLRMANVRDLTVDPNARRPANAGSITKGSLRVFVHDISDDEAERARTNKSLEAIEKQIAGKEKKLANEKFVTHARPEIVDAERRRLTDLIAQRNGLQGHLRSLNE